MSKIADLWQKIADFAAARGYSIRTVKRWIESHRKAAGKMQITTYTDLPELEVVSHREGINAPDDQASTGASIHFDNYPRAKFAHVTNPETGLDFWYYRAQSGFAHVLSPDYHFAELETLRNSTNAE